jgi:hypothetical protein
LELSLLFLSIIFLYHTCDCENPFGYQRKTLDKKRFSKGLRIIRETNDQEILSFIARKSGNENICQYAVAKIHDQNLLSLILNDHNCLPGVRYQTRHKLKA